MRMLIPVNEDNGKDSTICAHFGHAPFFAVYNDEKESLDIFPNDLDHSNPEKSPAEQIIEKGVDAVFALDMGGRAVNIFREKSVKLKTGDCSTVSEVIENLNNLEDLEEGCGH